MKMFMAVLLIGLAVATSPANAQSLQFTRQLGTKFADGCREIDVSPAGNIFMAGYTNGDLDGENKGESDGFVAKYDSTGQLNWVRQFGSEYSDRANGVAIDDFESVYAAGFTHGTLGGESAGQMDNFVMKYDSDGQLIWVQQFGTIERDSFVCVTVDGEGNIFAAGSTQGDLGAVNAGGLDAFVCGLNSAGELLWVRQIGTATNDSINAISIDLAGNVYVAGYTEGSLGGATAGSVDAFIAKYASTGEPLWIRQLGASFGDSGLAVASDEFGNAYLAGSTGGLNGYTFSLDGFIAKYDSNGQLMWTRQFGVNHIAEYADAISADQQGSIYISGGTQTSLGGPNAGGEDVFVSKYDLNGNQLWIRQIGSAAWEAANGVTAIAGGDVYLGGYTNAGLGGQFHNGQSDAFLAKYADIPTPIVVNADSFTVFRGFHVGGTISDSFASDDAYMRFNPGLSMFSTDAPVWLVFDGNVGAGVSEVSVAIESNTNTTGLRYWVEFWNWNTNKFEVVSEYASSNGLDHTEYFGARAEDHVNAAGSVRSRIGWRRASAVLVFPWEVRLDRLVWYASN
jgi:hypothetical protein